MSAGSGPGPEDLLATWESGLAAGGLRRALLLHALVGPDSLEVPVGRRDRELFALRRLLFGDLLPARVACAECGEQLEFDFDVGNVLATAEAGQPVRVDGWQVRLPTSGDLLAIADLPPARAKTALLDRCVVSGGELTDSARDQIAAAVAAADPAADVRLDVPCVECGHRTKATVDIVACLWAELDAWARGLLLDVHLLARAYGWSEPEVLALSPTRRRYYLELVDHG